MILNMSGGSSGLNLKIVESATRPASPSTNTIWVNTTQEVTSYVFSSAAPTSPVEGMLWITIADSTGVKSVFTASREWITLYACATNQYHNGSWVYRSTETYLHGVWVSWGSEGLLFDSGNLCEAVTGGWTQVCKSGMSCNIGDTISFTTIDTSQRDGTAYTNAAISLSGYSSIEFTVEHTSGTLIVGLSTTNTDPIPTEMPASITNNTSGSRILTVDISGLDSSKYYIAAWSDVGVTSISKVRLVKGVS